MARTTATPEQVKAAVQAGGFQLACSTMPGHVAPDADPFTLRRTFIARDDSLRWRISVQILWKASRSPRMSSFGRPPAAVRMMTPPVKAATPSSGCYAAWA